jgi:coenzyme Q-binding protein COQ10
MASFRSTRRVNHSPADMFALVADVERYPEFLPLCEQLKVRRRSQSGEGIEVLVADMTVGYRAIHETFASRVTLDKAGFRILVEYIDGPFKYLENRWLFKQDNDGCNVEFYIDYEFKSRTLGFVMGAMFDRAFKKFSEAFENRADQIYGKHT